MALRAKVFLYANAFKGVVKITDFQLVEQELPPVQEGQFLAEAIYLSVDPYMRSYVLGSPLGSTMIGRQVAKVTESKNEKYPKGSLVVGNLGWRTHTVVDPSKIPVKHDLYLLPDCGDAPSSLALGPLGFVGNSAYYGFLDICKPKEGEVVVVSGAAGAVGILVGQIAKIKGCRVIGFAGSDEKCKWLVDELGFDKAINYKQDNLEQALKEAAPEGIDCYFDNVGGTLSYLVIDQMRAYGRISICGAISTYNDEAILVPSFTTFHRRHLRMEGFINYRWIDQWMTEGMFEMLQWIKDGKIKNHETITEGFENTSKAFIEMMSGKNFGKAIVKV